MSSKLTIPGRKALPPAFTYTQARAAGISAERLYAYRSQGLIDQVARGLYRWADAPQIDQDLLEIAHRASRGTLCLITALARHGLTDIIPPRIDIAVPRGSRTPALRETIQVHVFAQETFELGRDELSSALEMGFLPLASALSVRSRWVFELPRAQMQLEFPRAMLG